MTNKIGDSPNKSGYSVWENKNQELVSQIKLMQPKSDIVVGDTVKHWRLGECEVKSFINSKELLVFSNKHNCHEVHQLENKEEELDSDFLQIINDKFKIENYYLENFGILFDGMEIIHGIAERMDNGFRKESYDEVSIAGLITERFDLSDYLDGIKYESNKARGSVSMFFDADGNYVNRDYNFNIEQFKPCDPETVRQNKIDEYIDMVKKHVGSDKMKYDESKKIWFTDKFAYQLYEESEKYEFGGSISLNLDALPYQGKSYYHNGNSRYGYTPKKTAKDISTDDLLSTLRGKLDSYYNQEDTTVESI